MQRVIGFAEKDVVNIPVVPVAVPAVTSTQVLADIRTVFGEFVLRQVFNAGTDNMYYNLSAPASPTMYQGWIAPGQQLDCSNHGLAVNVYSVAGGTVGVTLVQRIDLANQQTLVNAQ